MICNAKYASDRIRDIENIGIFYIFRRYLVYQQFLENQKIEFNGKKKMGLAIWKTQDYLISLKISISHGI